MDDISFDPRDEAMVPAGGNWWTRLGQRIANATETGIVHYGYTVVHPDGSTETHAEVTR